MSEDKVYYCLNDGCRETFKHRMQRIRHFEKVCKETPKEKPIEAVVKPGTGYVCKIYNTRRRRLKHQNNVKRHKKYAKVLGKN